ncbi:MAG: S8 family serine peptidase [bacterium]|nr:S8 family serine peptidase [bacterium]
MKTTKKLLILGIFVAMVAPAFLANAADGNRYLVKSTGQFWKNAFNARNEFKHGFTADLNDWQLRFAKLLGVEVEQVKVLQVLPEEIKETVSGKETKNTRLVPADQTPWGIETVYGDSKIASTSGGRGVMVAVLDTGVNTAHPDLKARVSKCRDFTNARIPMVEGKCEDKNGHGTHVAGIIAADGGIDGLGIYGIAPEASLFAFKVCGISGACYADDVAVAIAQAADDGANIINLSLGSDSASKLITDAVNYAVSKKVLVVAAAGNDGPYPASIDYPAAQSEVIGVGAFDDKFVMAGWSSQGINKKTTPYKVEEQDIEFAAPGVNIESAWKNGGYAVLSGTSMAAPFVAGLAAKDWPLTASISEPSHWVRERLHNEVIDLLPPGDDDSSGFGLPIVK